MGRGGSAQTGCQLRAEDGLEFNGENGKEELATLGFVLSLLVSEEVSMLPNYGCWQKTKVSWVRDKGLHYPASRMSISVCVAQPGTPQG